MSYLIDIKNLNKIFTIKEKNIVALKDLNFALSEGEFITIMGTSGSGKTTLLNIVGLLDSMSTGQYFFKGKDTNLLSEKERAALRNQNFGFIFQSFFLLPHYTALENAMLPFTYRHPKINVQLAKEKAEEMLCYLGLKEHLHHQPSQLSGGQQQRVAIARALTAQPSLILADEPTGALDSVTRDETLDLLNKYRKESNCAILLITHDPYLKKFSDTTYHLSKGELL